MELDAFLSVAVELLAVPTTADEPEQLRRAVDSVVDFVGPGFSVERFESNGKPSALVYADGDRGATRPEFVSSSTATSTWPRPPRAWSEGFP